MAIFGGWRSSAQAERSPFLEREGGLGRAWAAGPVAAAQVQDQAEALGIAEKTLRRARKKLDLSVTKTGMEGGWVWSL
jgi:hypothetical protein